MKEYDEILRSDSGYHGCSSYNLADLERFPFWNSRAIGKEFPRYQTRYHELHINIRIVIILFSMHLPSIHTHLKVRLMNRCGICDLFIKFYDVTSPVG